MSAIIKDIKAAFGDVEPAPYNVVVQRAGYEERVYPARRWVCTTMYGNSRDALMTPMFRRLFCYISGRNEPNIRMDMTTPVLILVEPAAEKKDEEAAQGEMNGGREMKEGDKETKEEMEEVVDNGGGGKGDDLDGCSSSSTSSPSTSSSTKYTMGFIIPASHQEKPPSSSDQNIFIEDRPEMTVFVRRFSGFMNDSVVDREREVLYKSIRDNDEENGVDFTKYYVAQFDPPFKLLGRRNEVWVVVRRSLSPRGKYISVNGYDDDNDIVDVNGGGDDVILNGDHEKEQEE